MRGTLLTWTRVNAPPDGFEPGAVVGVVALADGTWTMARHAGGALVLDASVEVEDGPDELRWFRGD